MSINELQKQTNINIQEKANLIWEIATHLVGLFKPHEYGKVILPMTVLKRFDEALAPTKDAVVAMHKKLNEQKVEGEARDGILTSVSKCDFYNTSRFDFAKLIADPDNIEDNFDDYMKGFSPNVKDIIENFKFSDTVRTMAKGGVLFVVLQEFNSSKANMSPDKITSADMGNIFEELIRKFSESYDEQAGAHFTSRDIIYLMTELLIAPEKDDIKENGCTKTAYDMAMGTSQMLGCLTERLQDINEDADLTCFGQEFNPETFAIAKADMLLKGGNASGMMYGDTLSDDKFDGYSFDYIISNPPFGIDWKREKTEVEKEAKKGYEGRFGPGLPAISDGQMLFMLNGIKKLKEGSGRMAIIQNGSSLFTGDAGSGASEIRKYVIHEDLVEAIIQLPTDLFYNTGISTYIWVLTKNKLAERMGKVQLIDASKCFIKRRKNIGNKRVDLDDNCIKLIMEAYAAFDNACIEDNNLIVESKVFDKDFFGYTKVTVETPLKLAVYVNDETLMETKQFFALQGIDVEKTELDYGGRIEGRELVTEKSAGELRMQVFAKLYYKILKSLRREEPYYSYSEFEKLFNSSPLNKLSDEELALFAMKSKSIKFSVFEELCAYIIVKNDDNAEIYKKNGKVQIDKSKTDTEIIPLMDDVDSYIAKNVTPYNPDAFLDRSKDKIGYEIPFTRLFYKFVAPAKSEDIFAEIKELEFEETILMKELFGNE